MFPDRHSGATWRRGESSMCWARRVSTLGCRHRSPPTDPGAWRWIQAAQREAKALVELRVPFETHTPGD